MPLNGNGNDIHADNIVGPPIGALGYYAPVLSKKCTYICRALISDHYGDLDTSTIIAPSRRRSFRLRRLQRGQVTSCRLGTSVARPLSVWSARFVTVPAEVFSHRATGSPSGATRRLPRPTVIAEGCAESRAWPASWRSRGELLHSPNCLTPCSRQFPSDSLLAPLALSRPRLETEDEVLPR